MSGSKVYSSNKNDYKAAMKGVACGTVKCRSDGCTENIKCNDKATAGRYVFVTTPNNRRYLTICHFEAYATAPLNQRKSISNEKKKFSNEGWHNIGQWYQIDAGASVQVNGVVLAGRRNSNQWVQTYRVITSTDGNDWTEPGAKVTGTMAPNAWAIYRADALRRTQAEGGNGDGGCCWLLDWGQVASQAVDF